MQDNEIIIVGNGPSLLEKKHGKVIDSFHNIVRFNNFQLENYEQYVGTKTTIWSCWYGMEIQRNIVELDEIWINVPIQDRSEIKLNKIIRQLGDLAYKARIIPDLPVITSLQKQLYGIGHEHFWPSSGLLAIVHSIASGYKTTIAGIDSWSNEPFHYYEQHDRSGSHHCKNTEKAYIEQLKRDDLVESIT